MKTVSGSLLSHLTNNVTTLCSCWKVTRMDGTVLGFTDHDVSLVINGVTYIETAGYFRSAITNSSAGAVENLEVKGMLDDATITSDDLLNGLYDYAQVEIFLANWADTSMGGVTLRFGHFGEVTRYPSGLFVVELRGLTQSLEQTVGDIYQPECRADLGDSKCKIVIGSETRRANSGYIAGQRIEVPISVRDRVRLSLPNPSWELSNSTDPNDTGSALGWQMGGWSRSQGNFNGMPHTGTWMLVPSDPGARGILSAIVPMLVGSEVTGGLLDDGTYELEIGVYCYPSERGWTTAFRALFFNAADQIIATPQSPFVDPLAEKAWNLQSARFTIPVGARKIQLELKQGLLTGWPLGYPHNWYDDCYLELVPKNEELDYLMSGGIEFQALNPGVTQATKPAFDYTPGATTVDGTITWQALVPVHSRLGTVTAVTNHTQFMAAGLTDRPDGWYDWGVLEWLNGRNKGRRIECKKFVSVGSAVTTMLPLVYQPEVGDKFKIITGCDKSRFTCEGKFGNILNYRGEPDIPGTGQYFKVAGG